MKRVIENEEEELLLEVDNTELFFSRSQKNVVIIGNNNVIENITSESLYINGNNNLIKNGFFIGKKGVYLSGNENMIKDSLFMNIEKALEIKGRKTIITKSLFSNNNISIVDQEMNGCLIENNRFMNNESGITLFNTISSKNKITRNYFQKNCFSIAVYNNNNIIDQNYVYNSLESGIICLGKDNVISQNHLSKNKVGLSISNANRLYFNLSTLSKNNNLDRNKFSSNYLHE